MMASIYAPGLKATSWDSKPAGEYYNEAEIVARVTITDANTEHSTYAGKSFACGVTYTGRVVDSLKGPDGVIKFQAGPGHAIGQDYLVFLWGAGRKIILPGLTADKVTSRRGYEEGAETRLIHQAACKEFEDRYPKANYLATSFDSFYTTWNRVTEQEEEWIAPAYILFPIGDFPERHRIDIAVRAIDGEEVIGNQHWSADELLPPSARSFQGVVKWHEYREYILESARSENSFKYPEPEMLPNLVDVDEETRMPLPKQNPYRLERP